MAKINFSKPALTYEEQLKLLHSRGLDIGNPEKALFLLENISYFRLSGYWYPLLADKEIHHFNGNFNDAAKRFLSRFNFENTELDFILTCILKNQKK